MIKLENYFSGEKTWNKFFEMCNDYNDSQNEDFKKLLKYLNNNFELTTVIFFRRGKHSIEWLNSNIPALDNLKPIECLKNEKLILRLKECLLRMH